LQKDFILFLLVCDRIVFKEWIHTVWSEFFFGRMVMSLHFSFCTIFSAMNFFLPIAFDIMGLLVPWKFHLLSVWYDCSLLLTIQLWTVLPLHRVVASHYELRHMPNDSPGLPSATVARVFIQKIVWNIETWRIDSKIDAQRTDEREKS
jgi:hypothetical protein